jgi:protein-L-isoaspartate O-methyltransferase
MQTLSATYSPEDNKLRLYPSERLTPETFARVKAAGFSWAPKQALFVAPMWTPSREDLLIELCGEIGDEDKSLVERAEERSERFEAYSESRAEDSEASRKAVAAIAGNIPFGQPILVGHHSERHARKDAERIENGMAKAVKMWEASKYWQDRAAGAVRNARYKELPSVRARRIKGLEADKRKQEREAAEYARTARFWKGELMLINKTTGEKKPMAVDYANAILFTGGDSTHMSFSFPLSKYPRNLPASQYEGTMSLYSALGSDGGPDCAIITVEEAQELALNVCERVAASTARWIAHFDHRLAYERAMLAADGGTEADKTRPEVGGAARSLWAPSGGWAIIHKVNKTSVSLLHSYGNPDRCFRHLEPFDKLREIMSKAQVDEARAAGRLIREHNCGFWLAGDAPKTIPIPVVEPVADEIKAMKDSLRAGVQVVVANQLFPTPEGIALQLVSLADIRPGHSVLEPSAGTGALLMAMPNIRPNGSVTAVEINRKLADGLVETADTTVCGDFLAQNGNLGKFDRIVMNPPFENGSDIRHIRHALGFLKPGGRLVAICAAGPRQREAFESAKEWIDLPDGSFKERGTWVSTAIVIFNA